MLDAEDPRPVITLPVIFTRYVFMGVFSSKKYMTKKSKSCTSKRRESPPFDINREVAFSFRNPASILLAAEGGAEEFPQSAAKAFLLLLFRCHFIECFSLLCVVDG